MVNAKELRIGNLVMYNDGERDIPCALDATDIKNISDKYMCNDEIHSPIPLTPAILEKCGFERYDWDNGLAFGYTLTLPIENWSLIYEYYGTGTIYFKIQADGGYGEPGDFDIIDKCKHIHQLQNLLFDLTNVELQVSELRESINKK